MTLRLLMMFSAKDFLCRILLLKTDNIPAVQGYRIVFFRKPAFTSTKSFYRPKDTFDVLFLD